MLQFFELLLSHWESSLLGGVIVISAVIVIMGFIKKLFNNIQNKYLRKFLLALTSVIVVLPVSAIYFVCAGVDYQYFWASYGLLVGATIVTYWFYENTCLRELINKIGCNTIGKFIKYFIEKITGKSNIDENGIKELTEELQTETKNELQSSIPAIANAVTEEKSDQKIRIPISASVPVKTPVAQVRAYEKEASELKNL